MENNGSAGTRPATLAELSQEKTLWGSTGRYLPVGRDFAVFAAPNRYGKDPSGNSRPMEWLVLQKPSNKVVIRGKSAPGTEWEAPLRAAVEALRTYVVRQSLIFHEASRSLTALDCRTGTTETT